MDVPFVLGSILNQATKSEQIAFFDMPYVKKHADKRDMSK